MDALLAATFSRIVAFGDSLSDNDDLDGYGSGIASNGPKVWVDYVADEYGEDILALLYVDVDAAGINDGSSWANAFTNLQDALSIATPGEQIWVADGTYYPDEGDGQTDNDRASTFNIPSDVAVYGGFSGIETSLDERDWETNVTTLSGDLSQDDDSGGDNSENAYHVVYFDGVSDQTVLDGVTITGGNVDIYHDNEMDNYGGGILNDGLSGSSPQINNCIFRGNFSLGGGAGMCNWAAEGGTASPTLTNCTFNNNEAGGFGGGILNFSGPGGTSSPALTNCLFFNNSTTLIDVFGWFGGGGVCNLAAGGISSPTLSNCIMRDNTVKNGGGVFNFIPGGGSSICNPVLIDCIISGNVVEGGGGGICNKTMGDGSMSPTIINCIISGNQSGGGGAVYNQASSEELYPDCSPTFINCTISGNSAVFGGGIDSFAGGNGTTMPSLTSCILWNNQAGDVGTEIYNDGATPVFAYCDIQGSGGSTSWNTSLGTGNGNNIDADPLFVNTPDPTTAPTTDGDIHLQAGSPCINAGDDSASDLPTTDIDGEDRDASPDIGADEYTGPIDDVDDTDNNNPVFIGGGGGGSSCFITTLAF